MATSAPVLSSDVGALEDILDRSLAPQISDLTIAEFDVDGTAEHIRCLPRLLWLLVHQHGVLSLGQLVSCNL